MGRLGVVGGCAYEWRGGDLERGSGRGIEGSKGVLLLYLGFLLW